MKTYKIEGFVLGNYWGGGYGSYPSVTLKNNNLKKLMKEANEGLKEGWLDSGMGFDGLKGAIIEVFTTDTIKKNGKEYFNTESEIEFIGDLTLEKENFLEEVLFDN